MIEDFGHILIYGETGSGKTTLAQKICNYLGCNKIYVFTTIKKCYKNVSQENVFENFDNIKEIKKYIIDNHEKMNFIILFDDFNNAINTSTNSDYNELFTKFRHYNTRIINLSHTVKAVGKTVRQNCRYIFISSSMNNNETIKDLSIQYYNSNNRELVQLLKKARNEDIYNVIFIDKRNNSIEIMNANEFKIKEVEVVNTIPEKSTLADNAENVNYVGLPNVNTQLNFQKKAERDFMDNSKNNITYNNTMTSKQLIQTKKEQFEVKIMSMKMEQEFNREEKKERLKNNLLNPNRTKLDITNIIRELQFFAKVSIDVDDENYLKYGELFLKKNYDMDVELFENKKNSLDKAIDLYKSVHTEPLNIISNMFKQYG
mgnify:CR=1 FL=1|jgi:adenylate kinase family enzyme|tara:strand:- start:3202 stop:4320 length:1119 start_codon:yes stop_codon:yes gene_type:complete